MASIPIPRRYHRVVYLPSKHDGSQLEVLLSIPTTISSTSQQAYTGVVIAHPYGPLGGSYNNNVVGALLQWFETQPLQVKSEEIGNPDPSSATRESRKTSSVPLTCIIAAFNFRYGYIWEGGLYRFRPLGKLLANSFIQSNDDI